MQNVNPNANVMLWDCSKQGCFNVKKRLKLGYFNGMKPAWANKRINFGDVDGKVEYNGFTLEIEAKPTPDIWGGQLIMYQNERAIKAGFNTVFVLSGDAETMTFDYIKRFHKGHESEWLELKEGGLRGAVEWWFEYAKRGGDSVRQSASA